MHRAEPVEWMFMKTHKIEFLLKKLLCKGIQVTFSLTIFSGYRNKW